MCLKESVTRKSPKVELSLRVRHEYSILVGATLESQERKPWGGPRKALDVWDRREGRDPGREANGSLSIFLQTHNCHVFGLPRLQQVCQRGTWEGLQPPMAQPMHSLWWRRPHLSSCGHMNLGPCPHMGFWMVSWYSWLQPDMGELLSLLLSLLCLVS